MDIPLMSVALKLSPAAATMTPCPLGFLNVLPNNRLLPWFATTINRLGILGDCAESWACNSARHPLSAGLVSGPGGAGDVGLLVGGVRCAYPVASSKQVIIVSLVSHMLRICNSCRDDECGQRSGFYSCTVPLWFNYVIVWLVVIS